MIQTLFEDVKLEPPLTHEPSRAKRPTRRRSEPRIPPRSREPGNWLALAALRWRELVSGGSKVEESVDGGTPPPARDGGGGGGAMPRRSSS